MGPLPFEQNSGETKVLTPSEIDQISGLILSDSMTLKGTQLVGAFNLLQRLEQEKNAAVAAGRVTPVPAIPPPGAPSA